LSWGYFTNYYNYDCALLDENSIITSDSSLYLTINAFNNGGVPNFSTRMPYGDVPPAIGLMISSFAQQKTKPIVGFPVGATSLVL